MQLTILMVNSCVRIKPQRKKKTKKQKEMKQIRARWFIATNHRWKNQRNKYDTRKTKQMKNGSTQYIGNTTEKKTPQDKRKINSNFRITYRFTYMIKRATFLEYIIEWDANKGKKKNNKFMMKAIGLSMTCKTRLGRFRSSSSVICVRYVGRSNTGGLLKNFCWEKKTTNEVFIPMMLLILMLKNG